MRPAAGQLNRRVTFVKCGSYERQPNGDRLCASETEIVTVSAKVTPLSGRRLEIERTFHPTVNIQVTIRWRDDLTDATRIKLGTRYFEINGPAIDENDSHESLVFSCTELTPPPATVQT